MVNFSCWPSSGTRGKLRRLVFSTKCRRVVWWYVPDTCQIYHFSCKSVIQCFGSTNFTLQSEAVFDNECNVFVTVNNGIIHKFEPLPIQDVVPVLECIDEFNVAYFSYINNEGDGFRIPYVVDRNNLSPGVSKAQYIRGGN